MKRLGLFEAIHYANKYDQFLSSWDTFPKCFKCQKPVERVEMQNVNTKVIDITGWCSHGNDGKNQQEDTLRIGFELEPSEQEVRIAFRSGLLFFRDQEN